MRIANLALRRIRRLFEPRYQPERYYMRGAGPACATRRSRSADI